MAAVEKVEQHIADAVALGAKVAVGGDTGLISTEVAPFGVFKESGIGRESARFGIDALVGIKYVLHGRGGAGARQAISGVWLSH